MFSIIYGILLTVARFNNKIDADDYCMYLFMGMLLIGLCMDITLVLIALQASNLI